MSTIDITVETIDAWTECLTNPQKHGLKFEPLTDFYQEDRKVTPKEDLAQAYIKHVSDAGGNLPKLILFIIMDRVFAKYIAPDSQRLLGFKLIVKPSHP